MENRASRLASRIVALLSAAFVCGYAAVSCAQSQAADIPAGVGPLPSLTSSTSTGAIVTQESVRAYRAILPEPLFDLVQSGEWVFEAAKSPLTPEHFVEPHPAGSSTAQVSPLGEVSPAPRNVAGALFPTGESGLGDGESAASRAYKVLWNATSLLWRFPYSSTQLSLAIFRESVTGGRRVRWNIERVYPGHLPKYAGTLTPLFREKVSAVLPAVLDGLSWLTIRSLGATEDYVWVASPITGHVRRMTSSNRSDDIFAGAFSPDDLFVWSGKVESVKPTAMARQTLLVPFAKRSLIKDGKEPGAGPCQKRVSGAPGVVELNESSHRFRDAASYVPTNVIMAPRSVARVDFASQDPFSLDTTTSLFIDESTNVPVYKIVFGRDGRMSRFVVGVIGAVTSESKTQPLPVAQVVVRAAKGDRSVLMIDNLTVCPGLPENVSFRTFDPVGLVPEKEQVQQNASPADRAHSTEPEAGSQEQFED